MIVKDILSLESNSLRSENLPDRAIGSKFRAFSC
jgi:hypothetical protein